MANIFIKSANSLVGGGEEEDFFLGEKPKQTLSIISVRYNNTFAVPSGPPISLIATPVSPTSFILNWEKPLENERNGDIVGYAINVTNLDTEQLQQISVGLISNYTFSNLKPFTIYESTISARTSIGLGPYSSSVYVTTLEDGRQREAF